RPCVLLPAASRQHRRSRREAPPTDPALHLHRLGKPHRQRTAHWSSPLPALSSPGLPFACLLGSLLSRSAFASHPCGLDPAPDRVDTPTGRAAGRGTRRHRLFPREPPGGGGGGCASG